MIRLTAWNYIFQPDTTTMHAKTATSDKKSRMPKQKATPKTPEDVRSMAKELRELADELDTYAASMKRIGIASFKPAAGNFNNAVQKIKDFLATQFVSKLLPIATKRGYTIHDIIKLPDDSKDS